MNRFLKNNPKKLELTLQNFLKNAKKMNNFLFLIDGQKGLLIPKNNENTLVTSNQKIH